jgi:5-methyltetrahydropteroyltriglutamate--homocysteine methyltransferase
MGQEDGRPPFRAEHVGSFPRPERLLEAREQYFAGKGTKEEFKRTEADCIREIVALQERAGIGAITDGEYPKTSWREFLFEKCDGFDSKPTVPDFKFRLYDGSQFDYPGEPRVIGKVRRREPLSAEDFSVLAPLTKRPTKANLPTPAIALLGGGDRLLDRSVYPNRKMFLADLARVMREEIADLARRGCTYLQMDEVPIAVLCDPNNREIVKRRGEDPHELIDDYIDAINESIRERPANMAVCVHLCRGNRDHGMADGGYEPVAERLFNQLNVDGFFLEYDTPRAGDFAPLRFVPKGKRVVLGLVSTKLPELETAESLKRRIDEAARFMPIEAICLSPQCGFASSARSRPLPMDVIESKLTRIVEVANEVWG